MADIYGSHFSYNGRSSAEFDLIMVNIETERYTMSAGTIEGVTYFNKSSKTRNLIDDNYTSSPVTFDVEIIKRTEEPFTFQEDREIKKWLFNKNRYGKLYIDEEFGCESEMSEMVDGEEKRLYLMCRFINPVKVEHNGRTIGYKVTVDADSYLLWQDPVNKIYQLDNNGASGKSSITITTDSDTDNYIYPKVTIYIGNTGGTVTITNHSDDDARMTKFVDLPAKAKIIMHGGDINYLNGNFYEKLYEQNFIRLLNGDNNFTVWGDVNSIEFEFSNRRMM